VLQAELEGMLELVLRVWSEGLFHGELKSEVRLRGHVWPWFWARAGVRQAVGCRRRAVDRKWEVLLRGGPEPKRCSSEIDFMVQERCKSSARITLTRATSDLRNGRMMLGRIMGFHRLFRDPLVVFCRPPLGT